MIFRKFYTIIEETSDINFIQDYIVSLKIRTIQKVKVFWHFVLMFLAHLKRYYRLAKSWRQRYWPSYTRGCSSSEFEIKQALSFAYIFFKTIQNFLNDTCMHLISLKFLKPKNLNRNGQNGQSGQSVNSKSKLHFKR